MHEFLSVLIAYLAGSLPTAYLAGRFLKKGDIRKMGGGNMGALNTTRELGQGPGLVVLLVDIAKGIAAVIIARLLGVSEWWVYGAGLSAVIGHCWPVYLKFRGGKGAATAIGVWAALAPLPFLCCLPIGLAVIFFTSNVTLGMTVGFLFSPLFLWLFHSPFKLIMFIVLLALFLAFRYAATARKNLNKIGWKDFIIEKNYTPWQSRKKTSGKDIPSQKD